MASNKGLIASILQLALAAAIDPPETENKTNAELSAILKDLKASAEPEPEEKEPEPEEKEPEPEEKEPELKFYIVAGKAITSQRGILSDGDEIKEQDLPGGLTALKAFVKSGYVVRKITY
jgi:hypothetical protein